MFIVFQASCERLIHSYFRFIPRADPPIVVSPVDDVDTEEIYIRLEIFRDIPLCRQDLFRAHACRALYVV